MASQMSDTPLPPTHPFNENSLEIFCEQMKGNWIQTTYLTFILFLWRLWKVRSDLCSAEETDPAGVGIYLRSESIDFFFKMVL